MGYVRIKLPKGQTVPDNALLYFNSSTNEYYIITDQSGNILTWETQ